ncbi:hypothetical protein PLESTB_001020200 [Pleodorina starrii]|uniref:Uncharacterized protein n=1 Tax=Pleodorina starrii TaxID=330485 RepID=A0A9W6BNW9_9CHLO|nr:hypothetical protein PLESTB_001020200 [Pleodorina starrii]GLC65483.1 hypothetical protein PLESTF_000298300 [Pleodorina starrii]
MQESVCVRVCVCVCVEPRFLLAPLGADGRCYSPHCTAAPLASAQLCLRAGRRRAAACCCAALGAPLCFRCTCGPLTVAAAAAAAITWQADCDADAAEECCLRPTVWLVAAVRLRLARMPYTYCSTENAGMGQDPGRGWAAVGGTSSREPAQRRSGGVCFRTDAG